MSHLKDSPSLEMIATLPSVNTWIGSLTRQAMLRRVENGGVAGKAPLGYINIPGTGGRVEVVEGIASLVRRAFAMAADGSSIRTIARTLARCGVVNRNGKPLGPPTLWSMLTNPFYIGKVRMGEKLVNGQHTPLITEELFEQVQAQLTARARNTRV
jgi:site-specific DNA recombinase